MFETKGSITGRLWNGLMSPLRGADFLLRHPSLMPFAAAPFVLSLLLLSLVLWLTVDKLLLPFHDWLVHVLHLSGWLQWMFEIVLWPTAIVGYMVLASFVFTALANLLAGPFNDRLSLRTEELATGRAETSVGGLRKALGQIGRSMLIELKKISFFLGLQILVLTVWIVPIFGGLLHTVLATLVTLWFLATEFLDYPLERRGVSYRMRLLFAWNHRYEIFGFGAAIAAWLVVPVVNFAVLPVSVVGGTLLYLKATEG